MPARRGPLGKSTKPNLGPYATALRRQRGPRILAAAQRRHRAWCTHHGCFLRPATCFSAGGPLPVPVRPPTAANPSAVPACSPAMQHNAAWVSAPGPHTAFSPLSYPLILCQNRLTARFYLVSCALAAAQAPEARPDVTKRHLRQHGGSGRCRAILLRRRHQLAREPRETREIGNQAAERLCRLHHQCRPAPDAVVSAVLSARAAGLALAPERVAIRDAARTQTTRRPLGHTSVSPRPSRVGAGATIKLERKHGRLRGRACRWRAGRTNATASLATRD